MDDRDPLYSAAREYLAAEDAYEAARNRLIDDTLDVHGWVRAGTPIGTVRDLIGHKDVQTTERYVCSYYDDPAVVSAPSVAAVKVLTEGKPTNVLPMRREGGKGKGSK